MLAEEFAIEFNQDFNEHLQVNYQLLDNGLLVYRLRGSLDNYNAHFFRQKIELAQKYKFYRIVLDCQGLEYISSTGVGTISAFLNPLKKLDGGLVFIRLSTSLRDVFNLVGFGRFVTFCDSLEEAVAHLLATPFKAANKV